MNLNLKYLAFIAFFAFCLTSCLKDKDFDNGIIQSYHPKDQNQNIVEIGLTGTSTDNFLSTAFDEMNVDTTIDFIPVNLVSPNLANEDIKVTLTMDTTLITDYNSANGTSYLIPSSSMYAIVNQGGVVTIPKGSRTGYLQIKLTTSNFSGFDWAFGFRIGSVDKQGYIISGNLNTGIIGFGIKNRYDGVYKVEGTMVDNAVSSITGAYPLTFELRTTGVNTIAVFEEGATTQAHHILSGGSPSTYGSFGVNLTFDLSTNKITNVANSYGQPASNGRSAALDPAGVNAWDPVTKTIKVKYNMLQPGTTIRTTFDETWTFVSRR